MEAIHKLLGEKLPDINTDKFLQELRKRLSPVEFDLKIYDILVALDDPGSHETLLPLINNIDKLAKCKSIDLNPKLNRPILESVEKRDSSLKTDYENLCMDYVCRNCKKNKTITSFIHRRCLDEAGDMRIQCINCNTIWYK